MPVTSSPPRCRRSCERSARRCWPCTAPPTRLARLRRRFPAADAVVFGHSHLPLYEEEGGFQISNPGSPTERRRAPRASMGLLSYASGRLAFEHVWL
jgi:predicted phosphodiesterase